MSPEERRKRKWEARVLHWFHARCGDDVVWVGSFETLAWHYRKFLKTCADCKAENGDDWKESFNDVDSWARREEGDFWFCQFTWEQMSDAYLRNPSEVESDDPYEDENDAA
jgi:hypothetical protein